MSALRNYQVVVWGCTGYTGRLVCEHLARNYQGKVRWAMAGRNEAKLEQVRAELSAINDSVKDVPLLVADAENQGSVDAVVGQADVVVSTAGPFARHGTPLVDAAVRLRTHYCDITGETWWIKEMLERYHYAAADNGVKIVHCCGYDSMPFDMGVWFVADYSKRELGKQLAAVSAVIADTKGGVSGGTLASLMGLLDQPREVVQAIASPYYLNSPPDERNGRDQPDSLGVSYNNDLKKWTAPSVMAVCNARVVRRSWALLGRQYGEDCSYTERMAMSNLPVALATSAAMMVGRVVFGSKMLLSLARRVLPAPGEGPNREQLLAGYHKTTIVAKTAEAEGVPPTTVIADVKGEGDPGYWVTSRWLLESALCLALQSGELAKQNLPSGGVLTPAAAGGPVLLERLQAAGTSFSVREVRPPPAQQ